MLLLATLAAARAGVWVRPEGEGFAQIGYGLSTATHTFDEGGHALPMASPHFLGDAAPLFERGRFTGHELGAYVEAGAARHVEVFGSLPLRASLATWDWAVPGNEPIHHTQLGAGDAVAGARYGRVGNGGAWSLSGSLRVPLYDNAPEALNQGAGNSDFVDDRPPLGQGTVDIDVGGAAGVSLGGRGWALAEAGLRLRDRGYASQIPARAQVGWSVVQQAAPIADIEGLWTVGTGTVPTTWRDAFEKGPVIVDGVRRLTLGGGLLVRPFAGEVGTRLHGLGAIARASAVVSGARTARSVGGTVSVFWEGSWSSWR
jgi:hypothetical protein